MHDKPNPSSCHMSSMAMWTIAYGYTVHNQFLPRCMECRRGLAMRILSVCPSVHLSVTRVDCDHRSRNRYLSKKIREF